MNFVQKIIPWSVRRRILLLAHRIFGDLPVEILVNKIRTNQSGWHTPDQNHNPGLTEPMVVFPGDEIHLTDGVGTKSKDGEPMMLLKIKRYEP